MTGRRMDRLARAILRRRKKRSSRRLPSHSPRLAKAANPQARSHAGEKPVEPWFIPYPSGEGVTSTVMANFFAPLLLSNR